uniref:PH domain containing endocytic trafficking adaptor 1 n=1 Tax=Rousettus aegyptiacus TaxID=9407 RepID=A0A7J8H534_ROUAE|nr:PH domain containing endocytic trafficking adaptor 1 [Rousettus aegyptiacus]
MIWCLSLRCGKRGPERLKACTRSHSLDITELSFAQRTASRDTTGQRAGRRAVALEALSPCRPRPRRHEAERTQPGLLRHLRRAGGQRGLPAQEGRPARCLPPALVRAARQHALLLRGPGQPRARGRHHPGGRHRGAGGGCRGVRLRRALRGGPGPHLRAGRGEPGGHGGLGEGAVAGQLRLPAAGGA